MANIAATVTDITLADAPAGSLRHSVLGAVKTYRVTCSLGTQTAGDVAVVVTLNEKLQNILKNGRTVTLLDGGGGSAGVTPGGTAACAFMATIDGTTLSFSVGGAPTAAAVAAGTVANVFVQVAEG